MRARPSGRGVFAVAALAGMLCFVLADEDRTPAVARILVTDAARVEARQNTSPHVVVTPMGLNNAADRPAAASLTRTLLAEFRRAEPRAEPVRRSMPINQQGASAIITPARARLLAAGPAAGVAGGGAGFFNTSAPAVSLSSSNLTFAPQQVGTKSSAQKVTLTNTGNATLDLTSMTLQGANSGDFVQNNTCGTSVAAGASCAINVTFTPKATGSRTASLSIADNAQGSPQTISLSGTGIAPAAGLSPASLSFPTQLINTGSAAQNVTLTNSGSATLNITAISFSGSDKSDFAQSNTCGTSVLMGASCTISLTFTPAGQNTRTAILSLKDNAPGSPQTVSLTGTGTIVQLSPASLNFGNQMVGVASSAQTITLANNSTKVALNISSISFTGSNQGDFAQTNTCGASVPVGGNCTISVTFDPGATGSRSASLSISDTGGGSPQSISLSGTGMAPAVTLSPASLSFGNQQMGTSSAAQTVGLTNTGSATLTLGSITVAGANSGDFAQANTCGNSVAAGASCAISVTFTPSIAGTETASVMVSDNAGNSPQYAGLNGTGVLPLLPVASLSPASLNFGYQGISTISAAQIVTLTNLGTAPLGISGIFAGGDFAQTNTCGTSVAAGASCTISVNFTPTILGAESGAITIDDNGAGSPQTVTLSGTGSDPSPAIAMPLVPSSTAPGATSLTLTVNGDGFTTGSVVIWNGAALATTFTSSTRLTASVPGADLAAAGSALVSVSNPGPGGGISNPEVFEVTAPTASLSFTRTDPSAGNAPDSIAVGDFNGDGIPDVAVSNWADNTITVFLANGNGTFQNPVTTAVGNGPTSAAAGDFNQDGKLDLVVVNSAQGTVSILLGNGNGTFAAPVDYATASGAESVVVGDLNGDGRLDLAVTNATAGTVSILMGNGDGTFQPHVDYPAGLSPGGLALGDLNGDGKIDLVVANYASATVSILLGNGDGSFQAPSSFATGNGPSAVLVADLNADGKPDVATTNATDGTVSILLGNGDGTLQAQATFSVGQQPLAVVTGDFNGDGIADLATANSGDNTVSVLLGNGDGTFQAASSFASGAGPSSLAASDFNRDGRLDLAVAGQSANDISLLMQGGVAGFSTSALTFGNQNVGSSSSPQATTLTNNGSASLTVSSIAIGGSNQGDFSESDNCPLSPLALAPGASCTMNVTFTPGAAGSRTASLNIADNAPGSPQTVSLSGTGTTPAVSLSPSSLLFGSQPLGTTSTVQIVTLTNTGSAALGITSMALGGANAGDFAETNTCGTSVPAGASCAISVTFTPTAAGARAASIAITDNASGSPQAIALNGTGTAPAVSLSPSSLLFGSQPLGTTSTVQVVTLTNTGSAALGITSMALGGANAGDFAQTNTCGNSVAAGASCAISVTFTPTAAGTRAASIAITDNASGSPQAIGLTGTGTAQPITLSPAILSFGNQAVATTSAAQTLTLTNIGTATITMASVTISGDFTQTNTCGSSLNVNASCTVSVIFTPTTMGARTGAVTFTDSGVNSPQTVAVNGNGTSAQLDPYGGDTFDPCTGGATGYFYTEKNVASQHWWFCDPAGNRFFMLGVEVVDFADAHNYGTVMTNKYGDTHYTGFSALLTRLQNYGFNTVGDDSNWYALPVKTNAGSGNPVKAPFIWQIHASYGFAGTLYPYKDLISTLSNAYTGFRSDPLADFFDPNFTSYANYSGPLASPWGPTQPFPSFAALDASPWLLGISLDDASNTWGFKLATPQTSGVGPHPGWMVAATTPNQVYTGRWKIIYPDTVMHAKQEWANWLQQTGDAGPGYASIAALNTAWGASYSSFGSSGTAVTGEVIGTGNGVTTSFTHTLSNTVVDPWSVAVLNGSTVLTGDCPWFDNVQGDCGTSIAANTGVLGAIGGVSSGTINYTTGALTVNFSTPPASGASIKVNYIYGGWPHALAGGTGLLDEDGTNSWFPASYELPDLLLSSPPQIDIDLDNSLGHLSHQYFSTLQTAVKAKLPHHLVFSQNFLGAYDRPVILQQAGTYLDALIFEEVTNSAQLATAYGYANKPAFLEERFIANPDSAFSSYPCDSSDNPLQSCQPTQAARGLAYSAQMATDLPLQGADGYGFLIGWDYWEMTDKSSEQQNFGLFSVLDNAYNGTEDLSGPQGCAPEVTKTGYICGLELATHGNYLGAVTAANASWWTGH